MKSSLQDKLAQLRESAAVLHAETDALTNLYRQLEEVLAGTGVSFWWKGRKFDVKNFYQDTGDGVESHVIVGYIKLAERWCIAAKTLLKDPTSGEWLDNYEPTPLTSAARAVRIEFVEYIEAFVNALIEEVSKMRAEVESAKRIAAKSIGSLTPSKT